MDGFEIKFNVFASSQEEADNASRLLGKFVDDNARRGIAVTADKIAAAVTRWQNNFLVTNFFK